MKLCPFCKTPYPKSDEEEIKRLKKLKKKGNADALVNLLIIIIVDLVVCRKIGKRQLNYGLRQESLVVLVHITT